MRLALAQINPTVGDLKGNAQKIIEYIERGREAGVDVIAFPELAVCGYPPEDLLYKKNFVKDNRRALDAIIKAAKNIVSVVGFVDADKNGNLYNAAAIISNGKLKGIYHKQHLPNYGVFDERRYFSAGDRGYIFSFNGSLIAVNICEDIWLKDVCAQQAKQGAKLLINISASPYNVGKLTEREALIKQRAKETKAFIAYLNLVGGQDELVFDGGSVVVNPQGKVIAFAKQFEDDLLIIDLDLPKSKSSKNIISLGSILSTEKVALKEKPRKRLSSLERIYQALVVGARDYIVKNRFEKVLIGLSGGIDSALVAAIAVDAIGKENVIGVTMPSRYSSEGTRGDAHTLAKNLGIQCWEIPIENIFESFLGSLKPHFEGQAPNIAEENIQARIRGNLLMAISNKFGWMVLTTGNKSEFATGYCTLYGDMSGGFAVIKDVPKTKVYELCRLINDRQQKEIIPQSTIDRAPTAELRHNQKDQDSLPPYDLLDQLLEEYVEKHQSFEKISRGRDEAIVKKVMNLVVHSEYKRRQGPPGVKITTRAFGKDWRLPITNRYKPF